MSKRRFFRKKPKLVLIDERVAPLVLPPPPIDIPLEEEDDILYGEDIEDSIVEPLRIFIGSGVQESPKEKLEHIWDFEEEDEFSFDEPANEPPLQISIGGIGIQFSEEKSEEELKIPFGVATIANAVLPEEFLEEEELFVPMIPDEDEEQNSVEESMSKGEWLYTNTEQENARGSIATLNTALLPIEEESVLLEGELDFSQLDIDQTIQEIEAQKVRFEQELSQEELENVLTLEELNPQDFIVPNLLFNTKEPAHIRSQTTTDEIFREKTQIVLGSAPIYIAVSKNSGPPYFEMGIAFAVTFCTLVLLWSLILEG
jgi:hypothetical protein